MKYVTGNYEARDVSEVAGEVKVEERSDTRNYGGLVEIVKKNAQEIGGGLLMGMFGGWVADKNVSNYDLISASFLFPTVIFALENHLLNSFFKTKKYNINIPAVISGMLVGLMITKYYLK